jgi:hypothetical protein
LRRPEIDFDFDFDFEIDFDFDLEGRVTSGGAVEAGENRDMAGGGVDAVSIVPVQGGKVGCDAAAGPVASRFPTHSVGNWDTVRPGAPNISIFTLRRTLPFLARSWSSANSRDPGRISD